MLMLIRGVSSKYGVLMQIDGSWAYVDKKETVKMGHGSLPIMTDAVHPIEIVLRTLIPFVLFVLSAGTLGYVVAVLLWFLYFTILELLLHRVSMTEEGRAFHGAEHKIINALESIKSLSVEEVSAYPIVENNCESNYVAFRALMNSLLLPLLIGTNIWLAAGYLFFHKAIPDKTLNFLRKRLSIVGKKIDYLLNWQQELLFVTEPDSRHVEVALKALGLAVMRFYIDQAPKSVT